jgi:hypothetical protein
MVEQAAKGVVETSGLSLTWISRWSSSVQLSTITVDLIPASRFMPGPDPIIKVVGGSLAMYLITLRPLAAFNVE